MKREKRSQSMMQDKNNWRGKEGERDGCDRGNDVVMSAEVPVS